MPNLGLRGSPVRPESKFGHYKMLAWQVLRSMNVEPALLLFSVQIGIQQTVLQPFLYWRRCIELYFDDAKYNIEDFCLHLSEYNDTSYNDRVEADISVFQEYLTVCNSLPALFLCPIICAWSDSGGGRKRPLLIALCAVVCSHIPYLFCTVIVKTSYYWILLGALISSFGGSAMVIFATSFSSITDESRMRAKLRAPPPTEPGEPSEEHLGEPETESEEDKIMTVRIGLGSATFMLGVVVGCLVGTCCRASKNFSAYYWPFLVSEISVVLAFFYVVFFARETFDLRLLEGETEEEVGGRTQQDPGEIARRYSASFVMLLNKIWDRLKEAFDALMAPREGNRRRLIWVGLALNFLQMCCSMGVGSLILLFVKRKPLSWTDVEYGYFQAYISFMAAVGMTVVPFAVNKIPYLKDSPSKDTIIVMFGCVSSAAYFSFFAFSATDSMVYASGTFMLFANLFLPGFRSFFSKLVGQEETARIFAAVGMLENFTPMIAALVFNNIYNLSLSFNFAGFAFLVSAVLHIPVLIGMGYIHAMMVRDSEKDTAELVENMERNEESGLPEGMERFQPESEQPQPEGNVIA